MRTKSGVSQRVERELDREVEILVLARVDLARERDVTRHAGIEVTQQSPVRGIGAIEEIARPGCQRQIRAKGGQRAFAMHDQTPEGTRIGRSRESARHTDNGYWTGFHAAYYTTHRYPTQEPIQEMKSRPILRESVTP